MEDAHLHQKILRMLWFCFKSQNCLFTSKQEKKIQNMLPNHVQSVNPQITKSPNQQTNLMILQQTD